MHAPPGESEKLLFSCKCVKLKKKLFGVHHQERIIVLTDKSIYNFRPSDRMKSYRWRLLFENVAGLIVSKESNEVLVLVVDRSEGYRFKIESCQAPFVEACVKCHKNVTGENLPLDVTDEKDLDKYMHHSRSGSVNLPSFAALGTPASAHRSRAATKTKSRSSDASAQGADGCTFMSQEIETGGRQGWLSKRKGDKELWDPKYVVLQSDAIRYYAPKKKGHFSLGGCRAMARSKALRIVSREGTHAVITDAKQEAQERPNMAGYQLWPFYVTAPSRSSTVEVACESFKDLQRWLQGFAARSDKKGAPVPGIVDGWLWKKNPYDKSRNAWRKRYFVLHEKRCSYYEMVEKGRLNTADGVSASATTIVRPTQRELIAGITSATNFSFQFNVNDAGRYYPFAADSKEDMQLWISSIQNINSKSRTNRSTALQEDFLASLVEEAPQDEVTIVFTGVAGISELWNSVRGEVMSDSIELHDSILRSLLRKFRGYEVKTEGATFMVAFFTAWEALAWCLAVQKALVVGNWPRELLKCPAAKKIVTEDRKHVVHSGMRVYMGMQVGRPTPKRAPTTGRMDYFGPCVNKAARVAHAANGGQILITDDVLKAVQGCKELAEGKEYVRNDKGAHGLKGIATPVRIFEVLPESLAKRSATFGPLHTPANEAKGVVEAEEENKEILGNAMPVVREATPGGLSESAPDASQPPELPDPVSCGTTPETSDDEGGGVAE